MTRVATSAPFLHHGEGRLGVSRPRRTRARSSNGGFTLVELMIALLIFGLLAASATALLAFGVDARQATSERLDALAAIVRTRSLLTADLAQAAPRLTRRADGSVRPAFEQTEDGFALVRRGWSNDDAAPRASLQRVEYRIVDERLERVAHPMLDGAEPGPPAALLVAVRSWRLRTRAAGEWRDRFDATRPTALPDAVELTLTLPEGEVRQLFLVGPGEPQQPGAPAPAQGTPT
jgi:general secretion pathway protein J